MHISHQQKSHWQQVYSFFTPLVVRDNIVFTRGREAPPPLPHTQFLVLPRGAPAPTLKTLPPTTTETQLERTVRGNKEVVSEVPTTHSTQSSRTPFPPNTAHAPGSCGGGKKSSWQTQLSFPGLYFVFHLPTPRNHACLVISDVIKFCIK